jgi:N6-adenosine-specific RNA methylase IME4
MNDIPIPHKQPGPPFRTILADPPWDVQQKGERGAEQHYPLMSLERIKAMPVAELAAEDAHLWLWVTNATLREGYDVAEAWGFTVRSPLTWVKFRLGLGNYLLADLDQRASAGSLAQAGGAVRAHRAS